MSRGGDRRSKSFQSSSVEQRKGERAKLIESLYIPRTTAHRWERMAAIPEAEFERRLEEKRDRGEAISTAGMLREREALRERDTAALNQLKRLWTSASDSERQAFIEWIRG